MELKTVGPGAPGSHGQAAAGPEGAERLSDGAAVRIMDDMVLHTMREYQAILDNAWIGIVLTRDRHVVHCNRRAAQLFGWEHGELIGKPGSVFYPSMEDYYAIGAQAGPILAAGEVFECEVRMQRHDGSTFLCHVLAKSVSTENPGEGTIWIAEDVTEARQVQNRLSRLLLEHRAIFDNASIGILFTRDGRIQQCNTHYGRMFGWHPEHLLGRPSSVFFSNDEDYAAFGRVAAPVLGRGEQLDLEWQTVRHDGTPFWCRIQARAIDPADPGQGTIWITEDISERRLSEEKLNALLLEQQAILDNALIGITILHERTILRCNRRFEELFGYAPGELDHAPMRLLYPDESAYRLGGTPYSALAAGQSHQREQLLVRKDGSAFWCRLSGRAIDARKPDAGSVWLFDDVTAQKEAEQRLHQALFEQNLIFENATVGISFNKDRAIVRCNQRLDEMFGFERGGLSGRPAQTLFAKEEDYAAVGELMREYGPLGINIDQELQLQRRDGGIFWCKISGRPLPDSQDDPDIAWIWIFDDITARRDAEEALRRAHEELEQRVAERTAELAEMNLKLQEEIAEREDAEKRVLHIANHDALTGLPNRRLLHDRLTQALALAHREKKQVAILFIDLDRFKTINDSLGHVVGDTLLQNIANRLVHTLREGDTVSRLGGDEFLIVLPGIKQDSAAATAAKKILAALAPPVLVGTHELRVTPSIGISLYPDDGNDTDTLLRNADSAMYHAKNAGRNNYQFYTEEMNRAASDRLQLESSLHRALDNGDLRIFFQPRIDLSSGRPCSLEVLVRWPHPEHGYIPPSQFIPIAEESGLIVDIGTWVLREACRQNVAWRQAGVCDLPISVNLSPRQFQQKGLADSISRILAETGLAAHCLELEITESSLMHDTGHTLAILDRLHSLGLRLSIDDFGTGYSSLNYLKRFPVDVLKIDQSFVRDIAVDPDDASIVNAVIVLAKSLGLRVVAEGVETAEQLEFIERHGCDEAQGYYFSRPLPPDVLAPLLQTQRIGQPASV